MNKILLIIKREYLTRIKKKSFIIMTILGPLIFAGFLIVPSILISMEDDSNNNIAYIDETGIFHQSLEDTKLISFEDVSHKYYDADSCVYQLNKAKQELLTKVSKYNILLYIPQTTIQGESATIQLFSRHQPNIGIKLYITNNIQKQIEDIKLSKKAEEYGISVENIDDILKAINTTIQATTSIIDDKGSEKESSTSLAMIIGYVAGILIYTFVFMYGAQLMRGVIEEKSNRIIEVIISSVKPFQLMMGKILGIALVGLTQFAVWVALTFSIVIFAQSLFLKDANTKMMSENEVSMSQEFVPNNAFSDSSSKTELDGMIRSLKTINYPTIIGFFIFYFLMGYLLYASMFAVVGSAVDNEADSQQFMLPISIPLFLGIFIMMTAIKNPSGSLAYWFSIIPFTSPIVMMVRIPFGVPAIDLIISMSLLVISFVLMTWLASKIYRIGILMYGKKITYKELWKWLRYGG